MYLWAGLVAFGVVVVSLFSGWPSVIGLSVMTLTALLLTFGLPGHPGVIEKSRADDVARPSADLGPRGEPATRD